MAKKKFLGLKQSAFESGLKTVFQDYTQIYQLPESYMAKNGVICVVAHIPMVPITDFGKFALIKHNFLTFILDGRLVKV